ncbi:DEAD-box ATP-dependent RNA helicase 5 [Morus notabilis]|uniref:DEAD-box ATP-dependent RNA helicase 5 n=1 Tax=Morus notabilis TaxID=981085 RepID=W9SD60_9ROSA|nr:DEAD-box ATP-dependent RNA helicase 5 [Morus notabilis]
MGRKLKEATPPSDPEIPNDPELNSEKKKKKKKKNKNKDPENTIHSPKRKIEELEKTEEFSDSKERKKKNKKKKEKENKNEDEGLEENGKNEQSGIHEDGHVAVTGKDVKDAKYAPLKSFAESKLPSDVLQCCRNFESPSPIQSRAWPFLLDGRDFIGIAATGSGKTLAFGVPGIMHILKKRKGTFSKGRNPLCLVLSPTRELAQQISDVLCEAGKPCGVISVCLYGGTSKVAQISALKSGVNYKEMPHLPFYASANIGDEDTRLLNKMQFKMQKQTKIYTKTTKVLPPNLSSTISSMYRQSRTQGKV